MQNCENNVSASTRVKSPMRRKYHVYNSEDQIRQLERVDMNPSEEVMRPPVVYRKPEILMHNFPNNINVLKTPFMSNKTYKKEEKKVNGQKLINNPKKKEPFETKLKDLKTQLLIMKVNWLDGHCNMELTRDCTLAQSMKQIMKVDLYKELKIDFKGEVSYDAGGIIREWFTVLLKELESKTLNIFEKSDSPDYSYIINTNIKPSAKNLEYFNFIGKLIAKALLDNVTINTCFNRLIYKMILEEEITFDDLVFIDKPLFNSLKELKKLSENNGSLTDLCLFYVCNSKDAQGTVVTEELIENGSEVPVTDIEDYIERRIQFMVYKNQIFVNEIKSSLYKIIPQKHLSVFTADEFELILNGRPFIDIEEWKLNTQYKGSYCPNHNVIKWFWDCLSTVSQEELSRFLQFSTGTCRVPIGGFAELESNRGEISKFCIVQVNYIPKVRNFIKAHTCFNRIELPTYISKEEVQEAIGFIINNEILGFGID